MNFTNKSKNKRTKLLSDSNLLRILSLDPQLNFLPSYDKHLVPKLILLRLTRTIFVDEQDVKIYKAQAHALFNKIACMDPLMQKHGMGPINTASLGKMIKLLFPGASTKRMGSRNYSKYAYTNLGVRAEFQRLIPETSPDIPHLKHFNDDEVVLPLMAPLAKKPVQYSITPELRSYLCDEQQNDPVLKRCDMLLGNFANFDVGMMCKDWSSANIHGIFLRNSLDFKFDIDLLFQTAPTFEEINNVNGLDIGVTSNINKLNILNLLMELLRTYTGEDGKMVYLRFQNSTKEILEWFTRQKSQTFGNFWILKCYMDEFLGYLVRGGITVFL